MSEYNAHQDMEVILQRFEVLRAKPQDEILAFALDLQDASLANKPVHRVEVISARMALLEQHLLGLPPGLHAVVDHYVVKGPKMTQRADYPAAEIEKCARDLKESATTHTAYSFVSLFTLSELSSIGV